MCLMIGLLELLLYNFMSKHVIMIMNHVVLLKHPHMTIKFYGNYEIYNQKEFVILENMFVCEE